MSDEPHKVDRARPRVAATRFGTVMLLPQSGRIGADVNAAIEASAGDAIYFNVTVKTAMQMGHVLKLEGELEEATAWDDALTAICSAYLGAAMDILNQLRAVGGGPSTEYSDGQAEVPDGEV